jgi:shikimate kinase
MKRSQNLFLIGPMGAGKTTIGKQLAEILKKDFYDTDLEIENRCGASVSWIFDLEGEEGFRQREKKIIEELTDKMGVVIATGGGVVELPENRSRLSARGVVIYLNTSVSQQLHRTSKDKLRPLLQVDDKKNVLEELKENRDPLYRDIADLIVHTEGKGVRQVVSDILELLAQD